MPNNTRERIGEIFFSLDANRGIIPDGYYTTDQSDYSSFVYAPGDEPGFPMGPMQPGLRYSRDIDVLRLKKEGDTRSCGRLFQDEGKVYFRGNLRKSINVIFDLLFKDHLESYVRSRDLASEAALAVAVNKIQLLFGQSFDMVELEVFWFNESASYSGPVDVTAQVFLVALCQKISKYLSKSSGPVNSLEKEFFSRRRP